MIRFRFAVAFVVYLVTAGNTFAQPIAIDGGTVEGVRADGVVAYKGIPFASPPVGALRWHPPAPPQPWTGVKIADRFAPICLQRGSYPDDAPPEPMNEDCLYLNVWVPDGIPPGAKLPVMVWIYGGGLLNGTASTPLYAGDKLARRGVIVVTANYRLGALGFLAHPALTQESPEKVSGNYGLGYLIINSYVSMTYVTIIIAMVTLGVVGAITSAMVRWAGGRLMQWRVRSIGMG